MKTILVPQGGIIMMTTIISMDDTESASGLAYAAQRLRDGGLVAFPTETVYGLGANAYDQQAVTAVFAAKGRPQDNPLIVHIADLHMLDDFVEDFNETAQKLAAAFWPGPLTLVMKAKPGVLAEAVTAGLDSVGVRMPSHPVAIELIRLAGVPVAAPSANISGRPSPTQAQHVITDMEGKVDAIVDGGSCSVGLESTVVDVTQAIPMVLRPGGITPEQIAETVGSVEIDPAVLPAEAMQIEKPRSPGMKYRHYAPEAPMLVFIGEAENVVQAITAEAARQRSGGMKVALIASDETLQLVKSDIALRYGKRHEVKKFASGIFALLRKSDELNADIIICEGCADKGVGLAVMNRLFKASGFRIIKV